MSDLIDREKLRAAFTDMTAAYHQEREHKGRWANCQYPRCQNARLLLAALDRLEEPQALTRGALAEHLRGDGPCVDCGTLDNIVWFTENVVWNAVTGEEVYAEDKRTAILCIPCFVIRADAKGLRPTGWRLLVEWPWRTAAIAALAPQEPDWETERAKYREDTGL